MPAWIYPWRRKKGDGDNVVGDGVVVGSGGGGRRRRGAGRGGRRLVLGPAGRRLCWRRAPAKGNGRPVFLGAWGFNLEAHVKWKLK